MSLRLKDRLRQIPGGFRFVVPQTGWKSYPYASFETIVRQLIEHRRANPYLLQKNRWSIDYEDVCREVDLYNSTVCKSAGWTDYILEDGGSPPVPKSQRPQQYSASVVERLAVGANVIREMFGALGPIRDRDLALKRAGICLGCPRNDPGDWTAYFTVPAQKFVLKALSAIKDLDLKTEFDDRLNVCGACGCPLQGKIWARLEHILAYMPDSDYQALDPRCWIIHERTAAPQETARATDAPRTNATDVH